MNNGWQAMSALVVTIAIGFLVGSWADNWLSLAKAEEKEKPGFLQLMAHQSVGHNLLFSAYCDTERGHLIYTYTVAAGESPSGDLTVIKDGCRVGK